MIRHAGLRHRSLVLLGALVSMAVAPQPAGQVIQQSGRAFSTSTMTVARGTPVIFFNNDTVPHNVMSDSGGEWIRSRFSGAR